MNGVTAPAVARVARGRAAVARGDVDRDGGVNEGGLNHLPAVAVRRDPVKAHEHMQASRTQRHVS